jgi:hypothetical protein
MSKALKSGQKIPEVGASKAGFHMMYSYIMIIQQALFRLAPFVY